MTQEVDHVELDDDHDHVHAELELLNRSRLVPTTPHADPRGALAASHARQLLELDFLERELEAVRPMARKVPRTARAFVAWFELLRDTGRGQGDPLFPWLAACADLAALRWFLKQEVNREAGFDDLVALTQLRMPIEAKLELARNYWDELGRGTAPGMHAPMLHRLAQALRLDDLAVPIVWQARALTNLLVGLAANRGYAYHALGALGVLELTTPGRSAQINAGLRRCGVPTAARQYYALHATLDVQHAEAWNREILCSVIDAQPEVAPYIAEGALAQLAAGRRCFARYRKALIFGRSTERAA